MNAESDKRKVRFGDLEFEPMSLARIMRLIEEQDSDAPGEFLSERAGDWRPMVEMGNDFEVYPEDRLASMLQAGIQWVKAIDSGTSEDCAACMSQSGKRVPISQFPRLPPIGCTCKPWCRCVIVPSE